jgi:hypothetical protein
MSSAVSENKSETVSYKGQLGGYRPGSGRKLGQTNKYSAQAILAAVDQSTLAYNGLTFAQSLAQGYIQSIEEGDRRVRVMYEKMLLDKIVADKVEVTVGDGDTIEDKMAAFHRALNGSTTQPLTVIQQDTPPSQQE